MSSKKPFKIGTRGSLLAVTQCSLIQREIEERTDEKFELITITTQGDQQTDKPLWQMDGKDFFTKELDENLEQKNIDLVVHSYKDLGSERPDFIELQTITKRKFAHDILLIKKSTIDNLPNIENFVVGTSSPRRIQNVTKFLDQFLPNQNQNLKVSCETLRGNVNTRIEKLKNDQYHAIVLALAGIERLALKKESKETLIELLDGLDFMVLPQKFFTSSASQGALAIESHKEASQELKTALKSVHDEATAQEISREREAFNKYGGGCHLAVGVNVKKVHDYFIHLHNGTVDGKEITKLELEDFDYSPYRGKKYYFMYKENDFLIKKNPISFPIRNENLFITSSHCFHNIPDKCSSLWASGNRTMRKLVENGYWVNGSAEGFGHQEILNFKNSQAINIMLEQSSWKVLSHNNASSSLGEIVPCYEHIINQEFDKNFEEEFLNSEIIYWSSKIQYDIYIEKYPEIKNKLHAIGLGKTYTLFKEAQIEFIPCLDMNHLKNKITES